MGDIMTELLALSVSIAVLGGIWAFIALGPLGGFALVWVGFIAAGCFFAAGGDTKALSKTIVGMWRFFHRAECQGQQPLSRRLFQKQGASWSRCQYRSRD